MLTLGALVAFAGAVLALWLVRGDEIERRPIAAEGDPEPATEPRVAAA